MIGKSILTVSIKFLTFSLHIILLQCFFCNFISPQSASPEFEHISIEQGLFQSTINCIMQDSKGFLWLGTNDGLSRYDGYSFKIFRNISADDQSISENFITAISEDKEGNIWIGTISGFINKYDASHNNFTRYRLKQHPLFSPHNMPGDIPPYCTAYNSGTVTTILPDKFGYIWVGCFGSGLYQFDPDELKFTHYYFTENENSINSDYVLSIEEGSKGTLWIGTYSGGLNKLTRKVNPQTKQLETKFTAYLPDGGNNSLNDKRITALLLKDSTLYVGTYGGGLNLFNISEDSWKVKFTHIVSSPSSANSLNSNFITKLAAGINNDLWIGTFHGGINKFDAAAKIFTAFRNDPLNQNTIDNNDVVSLTVDRTGLVWSGTFLGYGLNKLNPVKKRFSHFKNNSLNNGSLSDNVITAFAEDSKGIIWIGTYNGGLNKFDRANNSFKVYKHVENDNTSLSSNYITSVFIDRKNLIWSGTYNDGLNIFNPVGNKFISYRYNEKDKPGLSSNKITTIEQDSSGAIWIGTADKGLNKVTVDEKGNLIFHHYQNSTLFAGTIPENNIIKIFKGKDGTLWTITRNGFICRYSYNNDEFVPYLINVKGNTGIDILSVCEGDSVIWLGTGNGLIKFDEKNNSFIKINNPPGLKDKIVIGILTDDNNNLWLSTTYGIIKYNSASNSLTAYNLNDGLQSLRYTAGAYFKSKNGELFFGGINGFNSFFPDSMEASHIKPEAIITSFKVANQEFPLTGQTVYLSSSENSFTLVFSSNDYTDPSKNEYSYLLAGVDEEWKYSTGYNHSAEYNDLPPGEYTFKLKSSNSTGIWSDKELTLKIVIAGVFWKSWWFILLAIFLVAGYISYLIYLRVHQFLEMQRLKTKLSADLHDSVGSGLTEISLLTEITQRELKNTEGKNNTNLSLIAKRSRELVDNMSDIVWLVNPKPDSLNDLVLRLKDTYSPIFSSIGVSFKLEAPESIQDIKLSMDKRQNIYLIFKEAINNSLKYSKANHISFNIETEKNDYQVILKDDGIGFDNDIRVGNGITNMKKRSKDIGADFKIKSEPGSGTIVTLNGKG